MLNEIICKKTKEKNSKRVKTELGVYAKLHCAANSGSSIMASEIPTHYSNWIFL